MSVERTSICGSERIFRKDIRLSGPARIVQEYSLVFYRQRLILGPLIVLTMFNLLECQSRENLNICFNFFSISSNTQTKSNKYIPFSQPVALSFLPLNGSTHFFTTLSSELTSISQPQTALTLFTHMLFYQAQPSSHTFPSLSKAASYFLPRLASYIGKNLHSQVLRRGVLGDPYVCTSFIGLYWHAGELGCARKVFDEIPEPCVVSYNAMLDACGKYGDMGLGLLMFSRMCCRDVYSWTSMIHGYMQNGCSEVVVKVFEKMMVHEDVKCGLLKPNEATFVSILSSCTLLDVGVALYLGRQVHAYMVKNEELSVFMMTALTAFYGKMGCLVYDSKVFDGMVIKQVCAWNAMISSLALNGREKQALTMYEKMRAKGLQPNEITFVAVVSACARAKLVDLGFKLFETMSHELGLVHKMEHYGCVVDLLGSAGLLQEAYDFIKKMPFEADATVLGALISAYRLHGAIELGNCHSPSLPLRHGEQRGNVYYYYYYYYFVTTNQDFTAIELGNEVAQLLLKSQPNHSGLYVQLSSIYAGAERWDHAAALRKAMLDSGILKVPAHSFIS
ncbi:hypothetical protein RND71_002158 [Anisodus tanguticus]|uniref:Pentatricopeptide repeat-containing protein n=1 Tax=Anisodus tanguticus TaxID=243964 RepID=A0AAE1T2C3_9SOLA|nr:hypothetical protein RND71_002158 [Anisodus tanguticus]